MDSHYDTIGVDKSASQEEIKKAFRKKAKELHPDKGGSKEECSALTHAYSVLKDPEKRSRYDAGEEELEPIEVLARAMLAQLSSQAIDNLPPEQDPMKYIREKLKNKTREVEQAITKLERQLKKYEKCKKRASDRKAWLEDKGDLATI